jgi:hypothetical protein
MVLEPVIIDPLMAMQKMAHAYSQALGLYYVHFPHAVPFGPVELGGLETTATSTSSHKKMKIHSISHMSTDPSGHQLETSLAYC